MNPPQVTTLDIPPSTPGWTKMRESIAAMLRERIREHDNHQDLAAPEPQSSEAWATVLIGECVWPVVREMLGKQGIVSGDLSMLIRMMITKHHRGKLDEEYCQKALDYLQRHGLQGSIIRAQEPTHD